MIKRVVSYQSFGAHGLIAIFCLANALRLSHQIGQNHQHFAKQPQQVVTAKIIHVALCDYHLGFGALPVGTVYQYTVAAVMVVKSIDGIEQCVQRKISHCFKRGPPSSSDEQSFLKLKYIILLLR